MCSTLIIALQVNYYRRTFFESSHDTNPNCIVGHEVLRIESKRHDAKARLYAKILIVTSAEIRYELHTNVAGNSPVALLPEGAPQFPVTGGGVAVFRLVHSR